MTFLRDLMALCVALLLMVACGSASQREGRIAGLEELTDQAERNGALKCAPRELALARSQLTFAALEMDQGSLMRADEHIWAAEPNARAALALSPPEHCARNAPEDSDGDGYADPEDKCPQEPENFDGYQDDDGCPDSSDADDDGIPDERDACPLTAEDVDGYLDTDGCPETDNDLDSLADAADQCPMAAEDPDGFEDSDGCPDLDNDRDGVTDLQDQCPNEIGSATREPLGCPDQTFVMVTDCEVRITQQIHFATNRATIRAMSYPVLDAVVDVLSKNPSIKLEVQGHTDNRGSASHNLNLSTRRALAVQTYLVSHGVSSERLVSKGYGFEWPLVPNNSKRNRALNRRVQFIRTGGIKKECEQQRH